MLTVDGLIVIVTCSSMLPVHGQNCRPSGWRPPPRRWGEASAFQLLTTLSVAGNALSGTLPPTWCNDPTSLPAVNVRTSLFPWALNIKHNQLFWVLAYDVLSYSIKAPCSYA